MKVSLVVTVFLGFTANAQVNSGPRFTAMASAGVALQDSWSMQQNQAGLAALKSAVLAIAMEKPFAGFDLSTQSVVLIVPVRNNVFGMSMQRFGLSSFTEQRTAVTYAKSFGNELFIAINLNHHLLRIESYGSSQTYSVEAGMQYRLNDNLLLGVHIANPVRNFPRSQISQSVPSRIQVGAAYRFSEKVLFCSSLERINGDRNDGRFGLEYQVLELFALRGGISANPFKQYAGFGINYQKLRFDFATAAHPVLGYSPQVALSYEF